MNTRERELVARAREVLGQQPAAAPSQATHALARSVSLDAWERALTDVRRLLDEALTAPGEDPMPPGWNRPAAATSDQLAETLAAVLKLVEEDASPEGFIEWLIPVPDPCDACGGSGKTPELRCPDGGKCHHECLSYGTHHDGTYTCWRVINAGPLSNVFPNDEWPDGKAAAPSLVADTPPCPKCGGTGRQWGEFEHLKDAEFALRARYRVGGVGPGSGGLAVFQGDS